MLHMHIHQLPDSTVTTPKVTTELFTAQQFIWRVSKHNKPTESLKEIKSVGGCGGLIFVWEKMNNDGWAGKGKRGGQISVERGHGEMWKVESKRDGATGSVMMKDGDGV